jgi:dethiobiotin synthetase
MAARLEGHPLPLAPVVDFCRKRIAQARADLMLVEGVGGLMSPIAERATGLDLMMALSLPTVLVGGSYLGAISHTLTALEVLRARGLPVAAVVVSASPGEGLPDFETTVGTISGFAGEVPVFAVPRNVSEDWAPVLLATARRLVGPGLADRP